MNVTGAAPASRGAASVRKVAGYLIAALAGGLLLVAPAAMAGVQPVSGTLDLRDLDGDNANIVTPPQDSGPPTGARAFIGDVNGDGLGDIAIGAPFADPGGRTDAGSVYVVFGGGAFSKADLGNLGTRGFRIDGRLAGDRLGTSITTLGDDLGDDGVRDFAIGAPRATDGGPNRAGVVYLIPGRKGPPENIDLKTDDRKSIVRLNGTAASEGAGSSLALPAGKLGLIVGAPRADPGGLADAGSVYVLASLTRPPVGGTVSLGRAAVARLDGRVAGARAGTAVGASADIDGDGLGEVLIGAPAVGPLGDGTFAGEAYIVPSTAPTPVPLGASGSSAIVIAGEPGTGLGASVAGIGDLSGDGIPDVAIGAPTASPGARSKAGSAVIVLGRRSSPLAIPATAAPGSVIRLDGAAARDRFGSVVSAANLDDSSTADLLVSAPRANALGRADAGAVYALLGRKVAAGAVDLALLGDAGVRLAGGTEGGVGGSALAVDSARRSVLVANKDTTSVLVLPSPAPAPAAIGLSPIAGCTTARDIEIVVDDSFSMSKGDPLALRRTAIDALLSKPRGSPINVGAIELGTRPQQIFPPLAVPTTGLADGRELATLRLLLAERIRNDAGAANYALGLATAVVARPESSALLLITDGLEPPPLEALPTPGGRRVYVLQLGSGARARSARSLRDLASATGGQYFKGLDGVTLPVALAFIEADLNCEQVLTTKSSRISAAVAPKVGLAPPENDAENLSAIGRSMLTASSPKATLATGLTLQTKTATLTLSFTPRPGTGRLKGRRCVRANPVGLDGLRIFSGKTLIARATASQVSRALGGHLTRFGVLRARGRCGPGYLVLKVSGLERLPGSAQVVAARNSPTRPITVPIKLRKPTRRRGVRAGWSGTR